VNDAAMGWSAGQPATKTADKKDGGQALDLLTIALKTDSNKPNALGNSVKNKIYWTIQ